MASHNTRISPDVLQFWQDEAARLRDQRNELRDMAAQVRGVLDMDIPLLCQVARALPPSRELTQLRAAIKRWEAVRARLANPHEEDAE